MTEKKIYNASDIFKAEMGFGPADLGAIPADTITPESLRLTATFADAAAEVLGDDGYFRRSEDVTAAANALRAAADEIERLTSDVADILTAANAEANRHPLQEKPE